MIERLKQFGRSIQARIGYYRRIYAHRDTPWAARILLWTALVYAVSPIDLIPDFIPVLGHLDDLIILPLLVGAAMWMVPAHVREVCAVEAGL